MSESRATIDDLIKTVGGPDGLLALFNDYKKIVGALVRSDDARRVLPDVRTFFSRQQLLCIALNLPEAEGRAFLGR